MTEFHFGVPWHLNKQRFWGQWFFVIHKFIQTIVHINTKWTEIMLTSFDIVKFWPILSGQLVYERLVLPLIIQYMLWGGSHNRKNMSFGIFRDWLHSLLKLLYGVKMLLYRQRFWYTLWLVSFKHNMTLCFKLQIFSIYSYKAVWVLNSKIVLL